MDEPARGLKKSFSAASPRFESTAGEVVETTKESSCPAGAEDAKGIDGTAASTHPTAAALMDSLERMPADDERFLRAKDRSFAGLDEREWSGPWMFIQLDATQFGMWHGGIEQEIKNAQIAVEHINRLRPKFVIVCGNHVNEFPRTASKKGANLKRAEDQVATFKSVMNTVDPDIPLVCLCGNHDVGDLPNRASIELYQSRFGDDYLEFWAGGSQCIVLNSSLFSAMEKSRRGDKDEISKLADEQNKWLQRVLADSSYKQAVSIDSPSAASSPPLFAFSHIPPFIFEPKESKGYFNLEPELRQPLLEKFKDAGVSKWFCGHYYRNAGGWDDNLEVVITAAVGCVLATRSGATKQQSLDISGIDMHKIACSTKTSGLRCVCITNDKYVEHKFFTLDAVPRDIDPSGLSPSWPGTGPNRDFCGPCSSNPCTVS